MEGLAPELTPKHRNLSGNDYFNSKSIDKNKTNRTVNRKQARTKSIIIISQIPIESWYDGTYGS